MIERNIQKSNSSEEALLLLNFSNNLNIESDQIIADTEFWDSDVYYYIYNDCLDRLNSNELDIEDPALVFDLFIFSLNHFREEIFLRITQDRYNQKHAYEIPTIHHEATELLKNLILSYNSLGIEEWSLTGNKNTYEVQKQVIDYNHILPDNLRANLIYYPSIFIREKCEKIHDKKREIINAEARIKYTLFTLPELIDLNVASFVPSIRLDLAMDMTLQVDISLPKLTKVFGTGIHHLTIDQIPELNDPATFKVLAKKINNLLYNTRRKT